MNGKHPWENLPDIETQKIVPYDPALPTHQAAERSSKRSSRLLGSACQTRLPDTRTFAIEDLLAYLSALEPNEQFSIAEVVKRIDNIDWGHDDLLNAGDVFLKIAKLWRLKWSLLLSENDATEEQPTTEEIWEILVDLSRKTTDYTRIEALYDAPEPLLFPRIKRQSPSNLVVYKEIATLTEIEALAHKETPQQDALALIQYLQKRSGLDEARSRERTQGEIALNLVAEKLFEGNLVRAFIAALFAGNNIKILQADFYGTICLAIVDETPSLSK